jgi:hypothetical protein
MDKRSLPKEYQLDVAKMMFKAFVFLYSPPHSNLAVLLKSLMQRTSQKSL